MCFRARRLHNTGGTVSTIVRKCESFKTHQITDFHVHILPELFFWDETFKKVLAEFTCSKVRESLGRKTFSFTLNSRINPEFQKIFKCAECGAEASMHMEPFLCDDLAGNRLIRCVHPPVLGNVSSDLSMNMNEGRRQRVWANNIFSNTMFSMLCQVNDLRLFFSLSFSLLVHVKLFCLQVWGRDSVSFPHQLRPWDSM